MAAMLSGLIVISATAANVLVGRTFGHPHTRSAAAPTGASAILSPVGQTVDPTVSSPAAPSAAPAPAPANPGGSPVPAAAPGRPTDVQPSFPIRATFYYPWFPQAWNQQGMNPFTHYHPALGYYSSGDQAVIKRHLAAMQYGNITVGIASWWGQGSPTDSRLPALLAATAGTTFRWATYYEMESRGDPSPAQIASDLTYIRTRYGSDPGYLRINGRFVVFVYADPQDGCAMADRWRQANAAGAYIVLKAFSGYPTCASQPDGWHQYAPAVAEVVAPGRSFSISPGFWKATDMTPRLTRDLSRWRTCIRDMVASRAPFELVTTFDEWGEGTSVESALEWASPSGYGAYLDALHASP
jgi:hypothetical protein